MIKFRLLKEKEIPKLSFLMKKIIPNIKYYPRKNLKVFLKEYSKKNLTALFEHKDIMYKDTLFLVAEEDKRFVGFLFGWNDYGVFWIDWLGVEEHHRREHIASTLIEMAEKKARKMKCHKMFLDTSSINFPAINLYEKHGYVIEAQLKNHWLKWNYDMIGKAIK
ncbi:MAG: GNAT family N-acetyltransferase [Candidatus Aenigmarchaeota archaeon]|nr:GNAT family N-acetyltransferase [Candidatus Aenigmarchaeota archaeon]